MDLTKLVVKAIMLLENAGAEVLELLMVLVLIEQCGII